MELYRRMREIVGDAAHDLVHAEYAKTWGLDRIQREQHQQRNSPEHRVYYVRVGDLIKVGTTGNLASRMGSYPPGSELLATEAGGHDLEAKRLVQFAHLRAERREWFHPGAALVAHIESLRRAAQR